MTDLSELANWTVNKVRLKRSLQVEDYELRLKEVLLWMTPWSFPEHLYRETTFVILVVSQDYRL